MTVLRAMARGKRPRENRNFGRLRRLESRTTRERDEAGRLVYGACGSEIFCSMMIRRKQMEPGHGAAIPVDVGSKRAAHIFR